MATKPKQITMTGMPKRDAVGKAAAKYLKAVEALDEAKDAREEAASALVKIMREKRRQQIRVEGTLISLRHMEAQDALKIKKPKNP
jgi:hypothetical protein